MTNIAGSEIFTALNIPAPGPHPSITCVQWSGDGQLIVSTKSTVFILTPDLGINIDNLSLLKTDRRNFQENGNKDPDLDLGWHRNLIELDRNITHFWASESAECGAINLGTLDLSWRSVAISPGNLSNSSTGSGTLMVVMNTNLELTLWCATRNHLKEAWTKIQDITATLKDLPSPGDESPQAGNLFLKTLQAQVNCMAWSQQTDFGVQPNALVDGSILALGNRAGSIIFMRYDGERNLEPIRLVRVGDEWITHLAWGPWRSSRPSNSNSYLACGTAGGEVVIVHVQQLLQASTSSGTFSPAFTVHVEVNVLEARPTSSDGKITALAWIDRQGLRQEKPTLLHARPGLLYFYQLGTEECAAFSPSKNLCTLRIKRQLTSIDSSTLYPVCGLVRLADPEIDVLIVVLFDGTFHIVRDPCTSPSFEVSPQIRNEVSSDEGNSANSTTMTSLQLSRLARRVFVEVEGSATRYTDVGRISGGVDFDGLGTTVWLHEAYRPTDFSYKHEAKHNSMLVVARLWQEPGDHDLLLHRISETFRRPRSAAIGHMPASLLRPILLHLCQRKTFELIWHRVLPLLSLSPDEIDGVNEMKPYVGEINDKIRLAFRRSLSVNLYGWEAFQSLRLRLAIADYCWKMSPNDDIRDQFGTVAQTLLGSISHRFMKVLVKHLSAAVDSLSEQDLPFLMRVIVQSLLAGAPPDLAAQAQALSEITRAKFTSVTPDAFGLMESCPACRSPVPLENLLTAVCPRGHTWTRCSITSFVLATPMVRTCSGCTRKAFLAPTSRSQDEESSVANSTPNLAGDTYETSASLPPSSNLWIPDAGRSWVVDELLEAARCCLYCGNRFVRLL